VVHARRSVAVLVASTIVRAEARCEWIPGRVKWWSLYDRVKSSRSCEVSVWRGRMDVTMKIAVDKHEAFL
jgi:hypothetical protein